MSDAEEGGVLVDDLALSGNEMEDEEMVFGKNPNIFHKIKFEIIAFLATIFFFGIWAKVSSTDEFSFKWNVIYLSILSWIDLDESAWTSELLQSRMHSSGQLNNDLALSDSDDEERVEAIKRGDTSDNLLDSF
ncbi:unnamed protein product [Strongylus vulgaris]|uniref:Uncharacterized protein n=1 Tax=Strongylus vulgaris TaxID=40348 RepID=A0A3P7J8T7_STRVU|nr:unnamed protein product [Strongylus vulgaris]